MNGYIFIKYALNVSFVSAVLNPVRLDAFYF